MSDATDAINDILEATEEYGSDIAIITQAQDIPFGDPSYDYDNSDNNKGVETVSDTFKAIIKSEASTNLSNQPESVVGKYNLAITLYTTIPFNRNDNKILYNGERYEITYISKKVLQNLTISYEVLVAN